MYSNYLKLPVLLSYSFTTFRYKIHVTGSNCFYRIYGYRACFRVRAVTNWRSRPMQCIEKTGKLFLKAALREIVKICMRFLEKRVNGLQYPGSVLTVL